MNHPSIAVHCRFALEGEALAQLVRRSFLLFLRNCL